MIVAFNFPTTITSASFVLRKYYLSLLYHFEQAYYLHEVVFSISVFEPVSKDLFNRSTTIEEGTSRIQFPGQESAEVQLGSSIMGNIDGKFDSEYMVTVNLGSDELKGVLYHAPTATYVSHMLLKGVGSTIQLSFLVYNWWKIYDNKRCCYSLPS